MVTIAFLDIDGVVLPEWSYRLPQNLDEVRRAGTIGAARPERLFVDPEVMACLIHLEAMLPDLKFVLSSSWRHSCGVERTIDFFERNGLPRSHWHSDPACPWRRPSAEAAALGATSSSSKDEDILAWLQMHGSGVRKWVVLDDDRDLPSRLSNRGDGVVILVDSELGIAPSDVVAAYDVLASPDLRG